ncbi:MAG TPA: glutamate-cysteine ligase family protein [Lacipirellulaceae bacterium]|nr:glutamate-cysteine ligase family protein [Lacipirellulaceae bacterium]
MTLLPAMPSFQTFFKNQVEGLVAIEIEGFTCDRDGLPRPLADEVIQALPEMWRDQVHEETLLCQLEFASRASANVAALRDELQAFEAAVAAALVPHGAEMRWIGAHPDLMADASWLRPRERSRATWRRAGALAPFIGCCGLHVHVDAPRNSAIAVLNGLAKLTPLFVALSATSPVMWGRSWRAASHRASIWLREMPTCCCPLPQFRDWADFDGFVGALGVQQIAAGPKDLHWPVRPTRFGTIEVRAFDMVSSMDWACELAALVQCCADTLQRDPDWLRAVPLAVANADFCSAVAHGPKAMLTAASGGRQPAPDALASLIELLGEAPPRLQCEDELHSLLARTRARAAEPAPDCWQPAPAPPPQRVWAWSGPGAVVAASIAGGFAMGIGLGLRMLGA